MLDYILAFMPGVAASSQRAHGWRAIVEPLSLTQIEPAAGEVTSSYPPLQGGSAAGRGG